MSRRPFAEYHLVGCPADWGVTFREGGDFSVLEDAGLTVGRVPDEAITVRIPGPDFRGWGGRRNHTLTWLPRGWRLWHLGHQGVIRVDGVPMEWTRHEQWLQGGSRVEPAEGLVFELRLRPDLEALWLELEREGLTAGSQPEVLEDALLERLDRDEARVALALRHFVTRTS